MGEFIDNSNGEPFTLREPEGDLSKRDLNIPRDLEIPRGVENQKIPDIQSNVEIQKDVGTRHYKNDESVQS